jgi:hypothetical protein
LKDLSPETCDFANLKKAIDGISVNKIGAKMSKREDKETTKPGFLNPNGQKNLGRTEPPIKGTDHGQYVYIIQCIRCGLIYGANGSDIWERKCPKCQGGKPGIRLPISRGAAE